MKKSKSKAKKRQVTRKGKSPSKSNVTRKRSSHNSRKSKSRLPVFRAGGVAQGKVVMPGAQVLHELENHFNISPPSNTRQQPGQPNRPVQPNRQIQPGQPNRPVQPNRQIQPGQPNRPIQPVDQAGPSYDELLTQSKAKSRADKKMVKEKERVERAAWEKQKDDWKAENKRNEEAQRKAALEKEENKKPLKRAWNKVKKVGGTLLALPFALLGAVR